MKTPTLYAVTRVAIIVVAFLSLGVVAGCGHSSESESVQDPETTVIEENQTSDNTTLSPERVPRVRPQNPEPLYHLERPEAPQVPKPDCLSMDLSIDIDRLNERLPLNHELKELVERCGTGNRIQAETLPDNLPLDDLRPVAPPVPDLPIPDRNSTGGGVPSGAILLWFLMIGSLHGAL